MHRDLPHARRSAPRRNVRRLIAAVTLAVMSGLVVQPFAHGDDLDDRKERVERQLRQTERDLGESSKQLNNATARLQRSQAELDAARAELDQTREALAAAQAHDAQMAEKLAEAQEELAKAKARVAEGKRKLAAQQVVIGDVARQSYQSPGTDLMPIMVLAEGESMSDLQTRVQWNDTMQQGSEADMNRLREAQKELDAAQAEQARIEKQVAEDRQAAAEALAHSEALEQQASEQEARVAQLVQENESAQQAAEAQVAADQKRVQAMDTERIHVDNQIAKRVAAQRAREEAEARRQAELRRAEANRRAAAARANAAKTNSSSRSAASSSRSASRSTSTYSASSSSSGSAVIRPVSGPITSKFGMRFHPVLRYWKLHDGVDYGASCGTPIRAVADGRVTDRYYNVGYGNRLIVDHGKIGNRYLSTSYNHLSKFTVSAGQRVKQGQVIGYVGNTGYSTGCHLHFMAWRNGKLINPVSLY